MKLPHVSRAERRSLMQLALFLLLASGMVLYMKMHSVPEAPHAEPVAASGDSLGNGKRMGWEDHGNYGARVERQVSYQAGEQQVWQSFPFDPNEADSTSLLSLGLTPGQVRGIYKFRALGLRYHTVSDFANVPGLTVEQWQHLEPLVRIGEKYRLLSEVKDRYVEQGDTLTIRRSNKLQAGETIDLNVADTTELQKVPGIGTYWSNQIVEKRRRLGGFVSIPQLQAELEGLPEEVLPYLSIPDLSGIEKLDVNHATQSQLSRHPYLRAYRAKVIADHVRKFGPLQSLDDLKMYKEFTAEDLERLAPYLEFK